MLSKFLLKKRGIKQLKCEKQRHSPSFKRIERTSLAGD
jgi:hypothetical protein